MKKGRIVKLVGGQYTVMDKDKNKVVVKPLGKFRHIDIAPKVGDMVTFNEDHIVAVEDRKNDLARPPVTNVDQAILIHSAKEPEFSFFLLDRFLVLVEHESIKPVIVVTKIDLLDDPELEALKKKLAYYETYYDVYFTSIHDDQTHEVIKTLIRDSVSVFAGQTGSGKSSLLNALDIRLSLETGEISKALGRGKHTTRHSELLDIHGGLVADTPGFSKLDFYTIDLDHLHHCYPDFLALSESCKFRGCYHINEPGCAVKKAVDEGLVPAQRYTHYALIYDEIKNQKKLYRKK